MEHAGTVGLGSSEGHQILGDASEGHQISAEIRKELNPPLLRVYLQTYNEHTIQCILDQFCWMPQFLHWRQSLLDDGAIGALGSLCTSCR